MKETFYFILQNTDVFKRKKERTGKKFKTYSQIGLILWLKSPDRTDKKNTAEDVKQFVVTSLKFECVKRGQNYLKKIFLTICV